MATVSLGLPPFQIKDGPGTTLISALPNGHLKCLSHDGDLWCDHIKDGVERRLDAESLWRVAQHVPVLHVEVPILPSQGLWAHVRLEGANRGMAYMAYLQVANKRNAVLFDEYFLGHLTEGEFRIDLRSMILDWTKVHLPDTPEECISLNHSFSAQMVWESDAKKPDKTEWFMQRWCTWYTGLCRICISGSTSDDFSDDVPDRETSGKKPFGGK